MADIKLAERLAEIIGMLNSGNGISISLLANQFHVSERTIRRDINERLSFLELDKSKPLWTLQKNKAGLLNKAIISKFSDVCGIKDLLPTLNDNFLAELFSNSQDSPYLIKPVNYESSLMPQYRHQFKKISNAIKAGYKIDFYYNLKEYKNIEPYKLVSFERAWYLAALDAGKLKTFQLGLIEILLVSNNPFWKNEKIVNEIIEDETIWFGEDKTQVVVKVTKAIASYFIRREILPEQTIKETLSNGSLLITTKVVNQKQIFPLIKSWIPNIEIISPSCMQDELVKELQSYLK